MELRIRERGARSRGEREDRAESRSHWRLLAVNGRTVITGGA